MKVKLLFTDGSYSAKRNIGYGAYLFLSNSEVGLDSLDKRVKLKKFTDTSSSKLELQSLLWALSEINCKEEDILIYSDSQNIINLPNRRYRLFANDFRSKNNRLLNNHELYREFYHQEEALNFKLIKVIGHQKSNKKDRIDQLFSLVDRASRRALRKALLS